MLAFIERADPKPSGVEELPAAARVLAVLTALRAWLISAPAAAADTTDSAYLNGLAVHTALLGFTDDHRAIPPGWKDAGNRTPDWAYGAIVTGSEAGGYTPSIVALVSKLIGNVNPRKSSTLPRELNNR